MLLAALAAAFAWFIAHRVLGHQQPFFAPIAAAITLGTNPIGRALRIEQLVGGVLLGIGSADGLSAVMGTSTVALGAVVLVTFAVAVISEVGLFGESVLFTTQAAVSAILVVTLHEHRTGPERVLDAVLGGGVAFTFGVLLFPPEPVGMIRQAERAVLLSLADTLQETAQIVDSSTRPEAGWLRNRGMHARQRLEALTSSCASARRIVWVAPWRWPRRALVTSEIDRLPQLDALVDCVLGLACAAITTVADDEFLPTKHGRDPALLGTAVAGLVPRGSTRPDGELEDALDAAGQALANKAVAPAEHLRTIRTMLHVTTVLLDSLLDGRPNAVET